jgi:PAS domain S-box-containing protein
MREGRLTAIVTLMRLQDRKFSAAEIERIEQLPIGEAVNMAVALDHQQQLRFGLDLIGRLGAVAGSIADVGSVLVDELRRYFGWKHVSLFRVNSDEGTLSIVYQAADLDARLPEDYSQSIQFGLLGHVARSGQPVRLGDVRETALYVEAIASTRSEMCLPVPGRPVRWILNVESSLLSAFALEEQEAVTHLLGVAGLILDRTLALEFNATVLDSVADAIIQTSSRGEIQNVNPACEKLLDRPRDTLIGTHLSTLISAPGNETDPPGFAARLVRMDKLLPAEIELIPRDGTPIPVLLSGESLPPQIGGKVYVASDLRFRRAVQRMDSLQHIFRQVASEIRVPLALAASHLAEILPSSLDSEANEAIDKSLRQLRRADLPLEKVIRLAAAGEGQELPVQPISLLEVAEKLVSELPGSQAEMVRVHVGKEVQPALAARPELEFCASSLLAFLLRMKAQSDAVRVEVTRENALQVLAMYLIDSTTLHRSGTRLEAKSEEEREFALAEPVIGSLMRRMRGSFEFQQRNGLRLRLALRTSEAA